MDVQQFCATVVETATKLVKEGKLSAEEKLELIAALSVSELSDATIKSVKAKLRSFAARTMAPLTKMDANAWLEKHNTGLSRTVIVSLLISTLAFGFAIYYNITANKDLSPSMAAILGSIWLILKASKDRILARIADSLTRSIDKPPAFVLSALDNFILSLFGYKNLTACTDVECAAATAAAAAAV